MKNSQGKKTFNLALRFVFGVFFITMFSGIFVISLSVLLYRADILPLGHFNPIFILFLFFLSSMIVGTVLAVIFSRRSFRRMNNLLYAVSEIGKGNFDVHVDVSRERAGSDELPRSINQMAAELKNLEIMRNDFINSFSHEFKTPIVSIQGFASRLLNKELSEDQKREYIRIIHDESARLADLSTNILFMSKLESLEYLPERKEFPLDEQIRQCVLLLEKQRAKKNIELTVDIPDLPCVGNEELLRHVWLNLIGNAIKFTPPGGSILVSAAAHENGAVVSVSDNGIGMPPTVSGRVFDKFYQGDQSHSTDGNGLGLSIAKKIIAFHGGEISVRSEQSGGSTFTVTLPNEITR